MIRNATRLGLLTAAAALSLASAPAGHAADLNTIMTTCANCHGKDGASADSSVPIIGGMSASYITDTLAAYKTKDRPCPAVEIKAGDKKGTKSDMCEVTKELGDADVKQVAEYLAKQKFVKASQTPDPGLAAKGQQIHQLNCEKCHSNNGSVADDDSGFLAGQWLPYLKQQITEFKSGARKADPKMKPVIDKIDAAGIDDLLNYYASLK